MKISARNQLKGTISAVAEGTVNGVVTIDLGSTQIKADITMEAIKDLGLKEGMDAVAIVKASNVMFAAGTERVAGISARNQIAGTVASVKKGAVNGHVAIETADGARIMGSITPVPPPAWRRGGWFWARTPSGTPRCGTRVHPPR